MELLWPDARMSVTLYLCGGVAYGVVDCSVKC